MKKTLNRRRRKGWRTRHRRWLLFALLIIPIAGCINTIRTPLCADEDEAETTASVRGAALRAAINFARQTIARSYISDR